MMPDQVPGANEEALQAEIARLNKVVKALMNRAERNASFQGSDFNLFQTAITLEDQIRRRTAELEAARAENEKITRALREREEHYRLLIENSPVSIHEIGMDGRIISMSRAGLLMHGVEEEGEIQGALYLDGVSTADRQRISELLDKAYAGEISNFEFKTSGPHESIVKSCFVPIKNKNGGVENLMGITEDITERKLAQEEIKYKNTILQTLQETSLDAILVVDGNAQISFYNQQFIDLWQLPPQIVSAGMDGPVLKAVVEKVENSERFFAQVQYLYEHRDEKSDEEIVLKDGRILDRYSAPIMEADGKYYGRVWYFRDISDRKRAELQIHNLAFYDVLTQLPNRRLLNDRLGQAMAATKRSGRYGALMFMDLDNFKPLNDTHGHEMGDLLLIEAAHRLNLCVRETDTVARFGGDEFVVMLSALDEDGERSVAQAGIVAEKIRAALAGPYLLTDRQAGAVEKTVEHHCSASIGAVLFINHESTPEEIFKQADLAMYQAKEEGRNRVCFFDARSENMV